MDVDVCERKAKIMQLKKGIYAMQSNKRNRPERPQCRSLLWYQSKIPRNQNVGQPVVVFNPIEPIKHNINELLAVVSGFPK